MSMMSNYTQSVQKVFMVIFFIVVTTLLSPHLHAESGVFGVSDSYSSSSTSVTDQTAEAEDKEKIYYQNLENLQSYLWALQPDVKLSSLDGFDLSLFSSYLSETLQPTQTEKGKVVGQYNILPAEWMELVLYQKDDTQGVFGLQTLEDEDQIEQNSTNYTIEAQSKLLQGIKVFYGYDALEKLLSDSISITNKTEFISQNAGIEFSLLPGMLLNADYKKTLEATGVSKAHKTFQLAFNPASFARFNAGYGIISNDTDLIDLDLLPAWLTNVPKSDPVPKIDDVIIKQLGLAVQPTNFSTISADYVSMQGKDEEITSSKAVFGVKLGNNSKEVNATYQMENQESLVTTSAGLELGLVDLATLKAVYSQVQNQEMSEEVLKSMLDLGLNLNIADSSVLRFQYKWVLPEEVNPSDETTAEARLEVRF